MSDLNITKWNEANLHNTEDMCVVEPVRLKQVGIDDKAKSYPVSKDKTDTVKVSGLDKKSMYFRLKLCYPKDFDAVMKAKKEKAGLNIEVAGKTDSTPETGKKK